jgi:hypothetical protein
MEKLSKLIAEVLASTYIKNIRTMMSQINWEGIEDDFSNLYQSSNILIRNIENIGEYDGEDPQQRLKTLKNQASSISFVLKNLLELQKQNKHI